MNRYIIHALVRTKNYEGVVKPHVNNDSVPTEQFCKDYVRSLYTELGNTGERIDHTKTEILDIEHY